MTETDRTTMTSGAVALWPGIAPGSDRSTAVETSFVDQGSGELRIRNVVAPTLLPVLPDSPSTSRTAVIVAPGGGFQMLSWEHEGTDVASWLAERGVAAFVLKYRLEDTGATHEDFEAAVARLAERLGGPGGLRSVDPDRLAPAVAPLAAADGAQAVRLVRTRAAEWGVRPDRIGLLGFSAGGFVTTAVALHPDPAARPDFVAPIYGASVGGEITEHTPPMFCVVAADDPLCLEGCLRTFEAWRAAGRPAELHVYASGGHGFGSYRRGLPVDTWFERLVDWMAALGVLG